MNRVTFHERSKPGKDKQRLAQYPAWPKAVFDLGPSEERRKNFSRAVSYFDAVLKSHPNGKEPGSNTTFGSVTLSPFAQFTLSAHGPTVHPRR